MEADGVKMHRVQNLAITINKIKFFLSKQKVSVAPQPILRALKPREVLTVVRSNELPGSCVKQRTGIRNQVIRRQPVLPVIANLGLAQFKQQGEGCTTRTHGNACIPTSKERTTETWESDSRDQMPDARNTVESNQAG